MYKKKAHIHFVGIGGIGMSGIAKILKQQGYHISGCDLDLEQKSSKDLLALGCVIHQGNNTPACHDDSIDILVYSSAIHNDNPEITAAIQRGIPTIPRALMLAELMRMKYSIAIAGAHGKTTTTSMVSHILFEAHFDPTVIVGGHLHSISTNAHFGQGDFLVAEADESDRSLTKLHPTIAVVTNIDREHLDVYKDLDDIKNTFKQFLSNVPFYGKAILCLEDPNIRSILPLSYPKTFTYGLSNQADLYAQDVKLEDTYSECTVWLKNNYLGKITIPMPGKHNVLNTLAAVAIALELGIPFTMIAHAIATFKGVDRRFTLKGTFKGAEMFDDYGHHPEEIRNTLLVARKRAHGKLIVVFQPHRYSRTKHLWNDFLNVLATPAIDKLFITDIYPASEEPIPDVTSTKLIAELHKQNPNVEYFPLEKDFATICNKLESIAKKGDLILFLGAGKMYKIADILKEER
jgi:UDP-N-acetylmuramate--alanine ligase